MVTNTERVTQESSKAITTTDVARKLGKEGEVAEGITNPKKQIESISGTATRRFPDELLHDERILKEVKNVSTLSYTNQLKDFNLWAQREGYDFVLAVREGATLSKPLLEEIKNGTIIIKNIGE